MCALCVLLSLHKGTLEYMQQRPYDLATPQIFTVLLFTENCTPVLNFILKSNQMPESLTQATFSCPAPILYFRALPSACIQGHLMA